jgi:hypothetical protein
MGAAVMARGDAAPVLEPAEYVPDAVPLAMQHPVMQDALRHLRGREEAEPVQQLMPREARAFR